MPKPVEKAEGVPECEVLHGDCLEVLKGYPDEYFSACVTDPPYGLSKEPDVAEVMRHWLAGDAYEHGSRGFMGRSWDSFVPGPEYWREVHRTMKPGAHLLAFAGTRTWDLLSMAIRLAGFENRDTIRHHQGVPSLAWVFGSGFPKSLDVAKAIDKLARRDYVLAAQKLGLCIPGNSLHDWTKAEHAPSDKWWEEFKRVLSPEEWWAIEREVVTHANRKNGDSGFIGGNKVPEVTTPATDAAKRWEGWGTSLKPAWEVILVFRKPLSASSVACQVLQNACGALNVEASRVGSTSREDPNWRRTGRAYSKGLFYNGNGARTETPESLNPSGRFPSNFLLSHVPGPDGCQRVGTKKVKPGNGSGTAYSKDVKDRGNKVYGKSKTTGYDDGYVGPDGMEEVESWSCAEGGIITVPFFSGKLGDVVPLGEPEYLLGRLEALLQEVREHSKTCNTPLRCAYEAYRTEHKLSAVSSGDQDLRYQNLFDEVACALGVSRLPGFRACCLPCRRSCGEHVHRLLEAARASSRQLADVLAGVHADLLERVHIQRYQESALHSSDGLAPPETLSRTRANKTDDETRQLAHLEPETSSHNEHMSSLLANDEGTPHSIRASSSFAFSGNCERADRTACTDAACHLLVALSFDLATYLLPSVIIQKSEIDINLSQCPVAELDRQSGTRKSGERKPVLHSTERAIYGQHKASGLNHFEASEGGASRFFAQFPGEPAYCQETPESDNSDVLSSFCDDSAVFEPDTGPGFVYRAKAATREKWGILKCKDNNHRLSDVEPFSVLKPLAKNGECTLCGSELKIDGHPTQKPQDLMKYLLRLVVPPGGTVLDPFAGSGSTLVAACELGIDAVGVEADEEFVSIMRRRLDHAQAEASSRLPL